MSLFAYASSRTLGRSTTALRRLLVTLILFTACTGCLWPRYYIDPEQTSASPAVGRPMDFPCDAVIDFKVKEHGLPTPWGYGFGVRRQALKSIESSGVFREVDEKMNPDAGHLEVTMNHVYGAKDVANNVVLGFITGYTWGLIGSSTTENYEITMVYTPPDGEPVTKTYTRSIYIASGLGSTPEGKERISIFNAWRQHFDGMLTDFESDPQVQVAMSGQRRTQPSPAQYPESSAPQIAALPSASGVQTVGLTEYKSDPSAQPAPAAATSPDSQAPAIAR